MDVLRKGKSKGPGGNSPKVGRAKSGLKLHSDAHNLKTMFKDHGYSKRAGKN